MAYYKKNYNKKSIELSEPNIRFVPRNGWNDQFQNVFTNVLESKDNLVIEAVAGSGKTTAIVESIIRLCEREPSAKILFTAFNTSVKEEVEKKLFGYNVKVATCHGLGYQAIRNSGYASDTNNQFEVEGQTGETMMKLAEAEIGDLKERFEARLSLLDLVAKAKTCLENSIEGFEKLIQEFDIDTFGYSPNQFAQYALNIFNTTAKNVLKTSVSFKGRSYNKTVITFSDQIWLPVYKNMDVEKFDYIFVDEAQDLSNARIALISKTLHSSSRIFAFGDSKQVLYAFDGANAESINTITKNFAAKTLPLSFTWRCGKVIVEKAKEFNPIIEAPTTAHDGSIETISEDVLKQTVAHGDAILSRKNYFLVKLFFMLAKEGKKVKMLGKDYGKMLFFRINSWRNEDKNLTARKVISLNDEWLDCKKTITSRHQDEHDTIKCIIENLSSNLDSIESVDELIDKCNMFSPDESKDSDGSKYIVLSSVHRFKGLERDRVFLIENSFSNDSQDELNLRYVAVTRAKNNLYIVQ